MPPAPMLSRCACRHKLPRSLLLLLSELAVELSFVIVVWLLSSLYDPTARVSLSSATTGFRFQS